MKKNIGGYKKNYSGVQADITSFAEKFGLSYNYFPGIKKTSLPIYYGIIGNKDISEIKIIEKNRKIEGKDKRIWIVYMNKFEGSDFDINGLSKEGRELAKVDDNISS